MPIVLTIDQRKSRGRADRIDEWVERLNDDFGAALELPFAATVGDELQGLTIHATVAVELVMRGARSEEWWIGIGLGPVERPLRETSARSRGPAFYRAREAVDAAKRTSLGFAVIGAKDKHARDAEIALRLTAFIVNRRESGPRAARTWDAIEMKARGTSNDQIADELGITPQAVGQRLRRAGYEEETEGRELSAELLRQAHQAALL